jgi:hypothetical protein
MFKDVITMEGITETRPKNTQETNDQMLWKIKQSFSDSEKTHPIEKLLQNEQIENSKQDRGLKRKLANWFMWILVGQLIIMNGVFILAGMGFLGYGRWALELYMAGTLAQVFGIVLVMTKNLFPLKNGE